MRWHGPKMAAGRCTTAPSTSRRRRSGDGVSRLLREALRIKRSGENTRVEVALRGPRDNAGDLQVQGVIKTEEGYEKFIFLPPQPAHTTRSPSGGDADERCEQRGGSSEPQLRRLLSHEGTKRLGKSDLQQPQLQDTQSNALVSILSKARHRDSTAYVQSVNNSSV